MRPVTAVAGAAVVRGVDVEVEGGAGAVVAIGQRHRQGLMRVARQGLARQMDRAGMDRAAMDRAGMDPVGTARVQPMVGGIHSRRMRRREGRWT